MNAKTFAERLSSAEENIAGHDKAIHGDLHNDFEKLRERVARIEHQLGMNQVSLDEGVKLSRREAESGW